MRGARASQSIAQSEASRTEARARINSAQACVVRGGVALRKPAKNRSRLNGHLVSAPSQSRHFSRGYSSCAKRAGCIAASPTQHSIAIPVPHPTASAARACLLAGFLAISLAERLEPPLGLDAFMRVPDENPLTAEKVALGRRLFSDPILSADRSVSCATCHDPERAFTDDRPKAVGVYGRTGPRRVPKLVNRGYGRSFFWDGRIPTLEEQVLQPVVNSLEMDLPIAEAVDRLKADGKYREFFVAAFGQPPDKDALANALASYVRTILSGGSRYDRYVAGESEALNERERLGLEIFRTKGNCVTCHLGPNLTDERFHNTGIGYVDGRFVDDGRFTVTGDPRDHGAFKTPTLRDVALTAPYMHDGSLSTIERVIEDYDRGGTPNPQLDPEIRKLNLAEPEKEALAAFLRTLTGTIREGLGPSETGEPRLGDRP